jgi:hypothetical protein
MIDAYIYILGFSKLLLPDWMCLFSLPSAYVLITYIDPSTSFWLQSWHMPKNGVNTMPMTVASVERSFSKFKLLKNYQRSVMSQERLNGSATLCIEKKLLDHINIDGIISDFASRNATRNLCCNINHLTWMLLLDTFKYLFELVMLYCGYYFYYYRALCRIKSHRRGVEYGTSFASSIENRKP